MLRISYQAQERLQRDNDDLRTRLTESHLDLEDATRSRRDLQQRVEHIRNEMAFVSSANEYLKVHLMLPT